MKSVFKVVSVVCALMFCSHVMAADALDCTGELSSYGGIDYHNSFMKISKRDHHKGSPRLLPGFHIYAGTFIAENVGLEVGADLKIKQSKDWSFQNLIGSTNIHRHGVHADLVRFYEVSNGFNLFASAGAAMKRIKATTSTAGLPELNVSHRTQRKPIARAGIGALYMLTDNVGIRAKAEWENIAQLRMKGTGDKILKDSNNLSAGLFVKF